MRYLLFGLALLASTAYADSLERFKRFVQDTQSARAEFEQKVYGRGGKLMQESRGSFVFQRPGRFRWNYAKPVDQLIVGDGERVWIYDRDLNQVTVRKLSRALGSTPAALLAGASDVEAAFELRDAGMRDGLEWLEARPKERAMVSQAKRTPMSRATTGWPMRARTFCAGCSFSRKTSANVVAVMRTTGRRITARVRGKVGFAEEAVVDWTGSSPTTCS